MTREDAVAVALMAEQQRLSGLRPVARPVVRQISYVSGPMISERPPTARSLYVPRARWDHKKGARLWTRAAMAALRTHASGLAETTPRDIDQWCPAYRTASVETRQAFWVGFMSALSRHESTYNPKAVGGNGRWFGLLQIYPPTAQHFKCTVRGADDLLNPAVNLSCAARIMAYTVNRDDAIAIKDRRWRGVAADWGPMRSAAKVADMKAWTMAQDYCRDLSDIRPFARPESFARTASAH